MQEAFIGAVLAFLLVGGYFLAGEREAAFTATHPCSVGTCNW